MIFIENDNNKNASNLDNSTINIVRNVSSNRNMNVKDSKGNDKISDSNSKKNCNC